MRIGGPGGMKMTFEKGQHILTIAGKRYAAPKGRQFAILQQKNIYETGIHSNFKDDMTLITDLSKYAC